MDLILCTAAFSSVCGCAVSVWKTTSRLDKGSSKDGQPTFNCLLLQFGVVAQGVQELADLMHEVEHQPASTILQVCLHMFCLHSLALEKGYGPACWGLGHLVDRVHSLLSCMRGSIALSARAAHSSTAKIRMCQFIMCCSVA